MNPFEKEGSLTAQQKLKQLNEAICQNEYSGNTDNINAL